LAFIIRIYHDAWSSECQICQVYVLVGMSTIISNK